MLAGAVAAAGLLHPISYGAQKLNCHRLWLTEGSMATHTSHTLLRNKAKQSHLCPEDTAQGTEAHRQAALCHSGTQA